MFVLKSKYNKLLEELERKERITSELEIFLDLYREKIKDIELGRELRKTYSKACPLTGKIFSLISPVLTKNKEVSELKAEIKRQREIINSKLYYNSFLGEYVSKDLISNPDFKHKEQILFGGLEQNDFLFFSEGADDNTAIHYKYKPKESGEIEFISKKISLKTTNIDEFNDKKIIKTTPMKIKHL